jgi:lipopolysaccharide export system permease protein
VNLLHRYLFRDLLGATVAGVALFAFLLLAGNAIKDVIGPLVDRLLTVSQSMELLGLVVPFVLPYALPMGLLTAVLLVLGRVSAQHEITAMRAAGLGIMRIAAPVLLLAIGGVAVSLVVNFLYAPQAKTLYRQILSDTGKKNPLGLLVPKQFVREFPGFVIYVGEREGDTLRDVWVWILDKQHRVTRFARGASGTNLTWNTEEQTISLELQNAYIEDRSADSPESFDRPPVTATGKTLPISFPLSKVFKKSVFTQKVSWMDFSQLTAERRRLAASSDPEDRARLLQVNIDLHEQATLAFSVLSLVMVGVPLGIRTGRTETSANLGLALLLTMAFYFVMIAVGWVDDKPQFHPELLLWIPNIVFQVLGGWMWWRLGRN